MRLSTIANVLQYMELYLYYVIVSFLEKCSTGCKTESDICYCNNTAPIASPVALVYTSRVVPGVGLNI